ncbi:MAG: hypothetical protein Kow0069_39460 [Promethearchaeota archaeon]
MRVGSAVLVALLLQTLVPPLAPGVAVGAAGPATGAGGGGGAGPGGLRTAGTATPGQPFYEIGGNATYSLDVSWSYVNKGLFPATIRVWNARLVDWGPSRQPDAPPYQVVDLKSLAFSPPSTNHVASDPDAYGNAFDYFEVTLGNNEAFTYHAKYEVTLNRVEWNDEALAGLTEDLYDRTDPEYQLYTRNDSTIQSNDPAIVNVSSQIVDPDDDVVTKAKKIQQFVVDHLNYELQQVEHGALWALEKAKGDCSEFADLTIALLRAQGIPARKVVGWAFMEVAQDGSFYPMLGLREGQRWSYLAYARRYTDAAAGNNLTGHAWVQYLVPGAGWVATDPTWDQVAPYRNRIDHIHLTTVHGQDFQGDGINPPLPDVLTEFSLTPVIYYPSNQMFTYDFTMDVEVLAVNLPPGGGSLPQSLVAFVLVMAGITALTVAVLGVATRRGSARKHPRSGRPASDAEFDGW